MFVVSLLMVGLVALVWLTLFQRTRGGCAGA